QVEVDLPLDALNGALVEPLGAGHADVVDQHVQAPVGVFDQVEQRVHLVADQQVAADPEVPAPWQVGHDLLGALPVDVDDDDDRAARGEATAHRAADAARATGDEHDLACEVVGHDAAFRPRAART